MNTSAGNTGPDAPVVKPRPGEVFTDPVMLLAFGFGSGLSPKAPGTAGSVVALLIYYLFMRDLGPLSYLGIVLVAAAIGVYLCHAASAKLGVHDHGGIVWDEFVGLWLTLFAVPEGHLWPLLGFALFRLFDIWKPFPIGWFDRQMKGGLGIMVDDIIAGSYAFLVLQLLIWLSN